MTITATPVDYSSVHGDLIYTVYDVHSTDSVTYPNYKYVADVYIGGVMVARVKRAQDLTTGAGIFNIGQIVRSYMATAFNPTPSALVAQTLAENDFFLSIYVSFGEEYSYTTYVDLIVSPTQKFFNHYNGRQVGTDTILLYKKGKLATNNSLRGSVTLSSTYYFVPLFDDAGGHAVPVIITPYGDGLVFGNIVFVLPNAHMFVLNIAPDVFNSVQPGTITEHTKYYTVQIGTQIYTIDVICESQYNTYMLHFLNQYGGFESKLFSKVSRKKYKITKKDFGKLNYIVDNTGAVNYKNPNGVYNESRSVYSSQYDEKLTLNSDLLTDSEYVWLSELILSPMIYIQDGAYFFPVSITQSDYEPKKAINDDLTNLTIDIEYGQQLNAQYR